MRVDRYLAPHCKDYLDLIYTYIYSRNDGGDDIPWDYVQYLGGQVSEMESLHNTDIEKFKAMDESSTGVVFNELCMYANHPNDCTLGLVLSEAEKKDDYDLTLIDSRLFDAVQDCKVVTVKNKLKIDNSKFNLNYASGNTVSSLNQVLSCEPNENDDDAIL